MADINIAAVFRSREYSPNHIGTDAAILNAVCDQLRKRGCRVTQYGEEDVVLHGRELAADFNVWITMSRSAQCIDTLQEIEKQGAIVINSAFGIENCRRGRMSRLLAGHHIPIAPFIAVDTNISVIETLREQGISKCWIKQADYHSRHKEDVTFVRHAEEAQEVLQEYFMRGITQAIICRHQQGELIRFYGVRGGNFFKWFFPMDERHFAPDINENAIAHDTKIDTETLQRLCDSAAQILDIDIYGGDCIMLPGGELRIIDVNDWPSFAPCRKAAAASIARFVLKRIK